MNIYNSYLFQHTLYNTFGSFFGGGIAKTIKSINRILFATDISYKAKIGKGCKFPHMGLGVVIGDGTNIGSNCIIRQNVTIGGKWIGGNYEFPTIGDNCVIGAGTVIIGNIHLGSNVIVGANAVVTKNFPDNCVIAGTPAKIIKINMDSKCDTDTIKSV